MKVLVITGSHHQNGTSAYLAAQFIDAASKNGHTIKRVDTAYKKIGGCMGCMYCKQHNGACVQKDDMEALRLELLAADVLVFATPTYYFGVTAQIKALIDRFFALGDQLKTPKKAYVLVTSGSPAPVIVAGIKSEFETMFGFMHWENAGMLFAQGVPTLEALKKTDFPQKAAALGAALK